MRQSALWRVGRRRMEKNWSFFAKDILFCIGELDSIEKIG
jgi:hypothetical protein